MQLREFRAHGSLAGPLLQAGDSWPVAGQDGVDGRLVGRGIQGEVWIAVAAESGSGKGTENGLHICEIQRFHCNARIMYIYGMILLLCGSI